MPYTYIITHLPTNVKYYGVQYKKNCTPEDLGVKYFSSSKVLKQLILEDGIENFSFEVRKIFESKHKALEWERKFLTRIDAARSPMWFNLRNGSGNNSGGYSLSFVTRQRMSKPKSEEHRKKLKEHLDNKRKMPEWTEERKESHRKRMIGHTFNNGRKHESFSEERCQAISKRLIGNKNGAKPHNMKIVVCPHCGKQGAGGNMTRYHFDKCKRIKPDI